MEARSAEQVGTAALTTEERGTSYEGRSRPNRIRLRPGDAADLRYLFCEVEGEMGVKSLQGGHQDALLRGAFKLPKTPKAKASRPKKPAPGMTEKDRELAALIFTPEEIAKLPGNSPTPEDPPEEPVEENPYRAEASRWSHVSQPDGAVGDDGGHRIFVVVEILPPKLTAAEKAALIRPTYTRGEAKAVELSTVVTFTTADGRTRRAYPNVAPRRMPPPHGTTVFPMPCKEDSSDDCNRLEDVEQWAEGAMPESAGNAKRERMHRCRAALILLERENPLHLVALYRAYGPKDQHARDDLWDRDVASLVPYTKAAKGLRAEKVAKALRGRECGIHAATHLLEHDAAKVLAGARGRLSETRAAIIRREAALSNAVVSDARRDAEMVTLRARVADGEGRLESLDIPELEALCRDALRLEKLETMVAGRPTLRQNRLCALDVARRALAAEEAAFLRLDAISPARRAPAMEESMMLAIDREIRVEDVLRDALAEFPAAPPGGETPVAKRERLRRNRTHRTDLIDMLGKQAEQILIAASNIYKRLLGGL